MMTLSNHVVGLESDFLNHLKMLFTVLVVSALVHGTATGIKIIHVVENGMTSATHSFGFSDAVSTPKYQANGIKTHKISEGSNTNGKTSSSDIPFKLNQGLTVNADECGQPQSNVEGKIVGGETAGSGSWPWQAGVYQFVESDGSFYLQCSATLIQPDLIITSAEKCLKDARLAPFYLISLGTHSISTSAPDERIYVSLQSIICHPNFSDALSGSNICIGKLVTEVEFNQYIQPVCLPSQGEDVTYEKCVMTGWGLKSPNINLLPGELQQAKVQILSNEECDNYYPHYPNDQFCAGESGISPCIVDEGNPLVCQNSSGYVLEGITSSYSENCGVSNGEPGLFTDVSDYRTWIDDIASSFDDESTICYNQETIRACGTKITQNDTVLRSPIVNENTWLYPSNTDCEWSVEAPPGYRIRLEFLCSFIVETTSSSSACADDYLTFSEPGGGGFRHCGSALTPRDPYISLTNRLKIEFHSDGDNLVANGFVLRIIFEKDSALCYDARTTLRCGEVINEDVTILTSPIVDEDTWVYPRNTDCEWTVRGKSGQNIGVEFLCPFSMEALSSSFGCVDDYLTLIASENGVTTQYRYCGSHPSLDLFNTSSNELKIRFHSDSDNLVAKGFVIKISILGNSGKKMAGCGALIASMFLATFLNKFVL